MTYKNIADWVRGCYHVQKHITPLSKEELPALIAEFERELKGFPLFDVEEAFRTYCLRWRIMPRPWDIRVLCLLSQYVYENAQRELLSQANMAKPN